MNKTLIMIMCLFQASCSGFIGNMDTPYGFIKFNEKNVEINPNPIKFDGDKIEKIKIEPTK